MDMLTQLAIGVGLIAVSFTVTYLAIGKVTEAVEEPEVVIAPPAIQYKKFKVEIIAIDEKQEMYRLGVRIGDVVNVTRTNSGMYVKIVSAKRTTSIQEGNFKLV
jgi:hypothetical protein